MKAVKLKLTAVLILAAVLLTGCDGIHITVSGGDAAESEAWTQEAGAAENTSADEYIGQGTSAGTEAGVSDAEIPGTGSGSDQPSETEDS